jgi:uncharacterized protein (DUF1778 family)
MEKKRGRPPLPENRRKGERIEFRAEPHERAAYEAAAQAAGLERSEWMRDRLNAAVRRESKKK